MSASQAVQMRRYLVNGQPATFMVAIGARDGESRYSFAVDGMTAPLLVSGATAISPLPDGPPVLAVVLPPDAPESNPVTATPQTEPSMIAALEASIAAVTPPAPVEPEKKPRAKRRMNVVDVPDAPAPAAVSSGSILIYGQATVTPPAPAPVTPPAGSGIFLYFGCAPVGVLSSSLVAYVNALDKGFREAVQIQCADIRSTNSQDYGFGKWKGIFSRIAVEHPPAPGHYVVTGGDERVEVVASALSEIATLVVRA